jgi:RHS repeat-associated protein
VLGGSTYTTTHTFDARGNPATTVDSSNNTWSFTYNSLGWKTATTDPDTGTSSYAYDNGGRVISQTDALSQQTTMAYDVLNRPTTKTTRAGTGQAVTVTWAYDQVTAGYFNKGKLTTTTDASGQATFKYNAAGQLVLGTRTIDGVTYTTTRGYNTAGQVLWMTLPDGDTFGTSGSPLTYNDAGQALTIPGVVTAASYNAAGLLTSRTQANGVVTTKTYSPQRMWLNNISTVKGATTLQNLTYGRDDEGKITSITSPFQYEGWTYGYDDLHRLTTATNTSSATYNQTVAFNAIGNITSNSVLGSYTYGAKPHAVTAAGANTYAYDANGNMTSGGGRTLTWDGDNRPVNINGNTYVYDIDGNRLKKTVGGTTTLYLGDGYEITGSQVTKYLSFAGEVVAKRVGATQFYIHNDHLGSVNVITDSAGTEVQRFKYKPWGDRLQTGTGHVESTSFTAQRQDETGLFYLHARYYDPVLARFISADPIVPSSQAVGLNRYAYAGNDPVNHTDTNGMSFFKTILRVVAGIYTVGMSEVALRAPGINRTLTRVPAIGGLLSAAFTYALGNWTGGVGYLPWVMGDTRGFAKSYAKMAIIGAASAVTAGAAGPGVGLGTSLATAGATGAAAGFSNAMIDGASPLQALKAGAIGAGFAMGAVMLSAAATSYFGSTPTSSAEAWPDVRPERVEWAGFRAPGNAPSEWDVALSVSPGGVIGKSGVSAALGVIEHLDSFSRYTGGVNYLQPGWDALGSLALKNANSYSEFLNAFRGGFMDSFPTLMRQADTIHFNLQGLNLFDITKSGSMTMLEFKTVVGDPALRSKTFFYPDGVRAVR